MSNYWRGFGLLFALIALFRLNEEQESIVRKAHKSALAYNLEMLNQVQTSMRHGSEQDQ
jgi:hypothetical protein